MRPLSIRAALAGHVGSGPVVLWPESSVLHGLVLKLLTAEDWLVGLDNLLIGEWSVFPARDFLGRFHFDFSGGFFNRGKFPTLNVMLVVALEIYLRLDC